MEIDDMIAVLQARKEGKTIEWRYKNAISGDPFEWTPAVAFDFIRFDYRVKPEPPKPREFWIGVHDKHKHGGAVWSCVSTYPRKPDFCTESLIHVREVLDESKES